MKECEGRCSHVLNFGWYPYLTYIPTNIFKDVNMSNYKLQQFEKQYGYSLCNGVFVDKNLVDILYLTIDDDLQDIVFQDYQFPNTLGQLTNFTFDNQQVILQNGNLLITDQNDQISVNLSQEFGGNIIFQSVRHLKTIEMPWLGFYDCIHYEESQLMNYKYLALEPIRPSASLEPLFINYVGLTEQYTYMDFVFIALLILSGAGVIETFFYLGFEIKLKKDKQKCRNELISFVDNNRKELE
ncbi:Hypothetical_protein [Hexamita inflata]|uniref:Hypothetical_protein n=1 Tax=Hexamita inflata TaxID=28002 RepID=A0AA86QN79_9EUKA|nr:Hypothetical protein HINF_LOCUS49280 [Hexamita inflata]